MPPEIHPQIQAILDRSKHLGLQGLQTMDTASARAQFERLAAAARETTPPVELCQIENSSTGPGYGHVPVRIYRTDAEVDAPVIVYFHGGGHVVGSLDTHDAVARYLAKKASCTLVSVDYRMGPEHPFPAAVDDCYAATRWVVDTAADLCIRPETLAVCGDSAGANLAAVVALLSRDTAEFAVAAQVLVYPVIDYRGGSASFEKYGRGYGSLETETVAWFMERYLPDPCMRDDWRACPRLAKLDAALPPALVITAECDVLRDDGAQYTEQLRQAGVTVDYAEFAGMTHGFIGYLGLVDDADRAHQTVATFLNDVWQRRADRR